MLKPVLLYRKKRLAIATAVFWLLLSYVVAALVWWFIALNLQNRRMADYRSRELRHDDPGYLQKQEAIDEEKQKKTAQYLSEGLTFLGVIAVSAVFLYRAVMRQIRIQQQQQNFMMAVTHELKTPISVAKLNLETMQKHQLDDARREKLIRASLQEIDRLDSLTANILISAQLEGGRYASQREAIDLSALTSRLVQENRQRFPGSRWETDIAPNVTIAGDPLLIRILFDNLAENAVKYSPAGHPVQVFVHREGQRAVLGVRDEGAGIAADEKKKIFRKFYRIGNETTRNTRGTGLGLYLARMIAVAHRATLAVTDNRPAGSIFTATFDHA